MSLIDEATSKANCDIFPSNPKIMIMPISDDIDVNNFFRPSLEALLKDKTVYAIATKPIVISGKLICCGHPCEAQLYTISPMQNSKIFMHDVPTIS